MMWELLCVEVVIWKCVICVFSYELNNLFVFILLFVYSVVELVCCGDIVCLFGVLVSIGEWVVYLYGFLLGYVSFVKLFVLCCEVVDWLDFLVWLVVLGEFCFDGECFV